MLKVTYKASQLLRNLHELTIQIPLEGNQSMYQTPHMEFYSTLRENETYSTWAGELLRQIVPQSTTISIV